MDVLLVQEVVARELWLMNKELILIFARNPEIGQCKKRLAVTVGDFNALAIYKILLHHTVSIVENLPYDKAVYYSDKVTKNDTWEDSNYQKFKQEGEDLGDRMLNAFKNSFQACYEKVIIVGSDIIDLKQKHIYEAFKALEANDVVIGPAEDGGYYLLGMKEMLPFVFKNKNWGTSSVYSDTLSDLRTSSVLRLETLNDIDVYDDLEGHDVFKSFLSSEN